VRERERKRNKNMEKIEREKERQWKCKRDRSERMLKDDGSRERKNFGINFASLPKSEISFQSIDFKRSICR
jgi:hypothetical protein